jgi:hypothetical protein
MNAIITHDAVKIIHYAVSVSFLTFAIILLARSIRGLAKNRPYTRFDKFLAFAFIINLYLQLILGLFLFTNLGTGLDFHYLESGNTEMVSKRLWPIEHIILMLFALFIANLGLIFSLQTKNSFSKFKIILIYYVISILLIAFSLLSIYVL